MFDCELCGGQFKNRSGLSGHKRMAHNSESTSETTPRVVQEHSRSTSPSTKEVVQECLEEYLGEHLEPIREALDHLLSGSEHTHGGDPDCRHCHDALHAISAKGWEEGFEEGVRRLTATPGVMAAREFNDWAKERNAEHPGDPVVTSFVDVPGVKEAIEKYQLGQAVVTITDPEERPDMAQIIGSFAGR